MRLLLINYEYPPLGGGAGTATAALAREFATLGADVRILTSAFGDLPARESTHGFTIIRIPAGRRRADRCTVPEMILFMLSAAFHVLRITHGWRPDATLAFFGIPGGPVAYWLRLCRRIPYLVSLRGGDVPGHQAAQLARHHRLTRPLIRLVWRAAAAVVANSEGLRREALATAPTLTIPVIPNGVDTTQFQPPPGGPGSVPATPLAGGPGSVPAAPLAGAPGSVPAAPLAGAPGSAPAASPPTLRLLFVGRLSPEKSLPVVLAALATLPKSVSWSFTIAGDGPQRPHLETEAARLGLTPRVQFTGWVARDRLLPHYQAADLFVFASTDEGMPNTVLEAMACGLPVIATRIAGCEDLVEEGATGLLVPPGNPEALAQAIALLAADPARRTAMAAAARSRAATRFDWRHSAKSYLSLLQAAVHNTKEP
jgi:glycosyltransferase involved in cell wall biosynthesis